MTVQTDTKYRRRELKQAEQWALDWYVRFDDERMHIITQLHKAPSWALAHMLLCISHTTIDDSELVAQVITIGRALIIHEFRDDKRLAARHQQACDLAEHSAVAWPNAGPTERSEIIAKLHKAPSWALAYMLLIIAKRVDCEPLHNPMRMRNHLSAISRALSNYKG